MPKRSESLDCVVEDSCGKWLACELLSIIRGRRCERFVRSRCPAASHPIEFWQSATAGAMDLSIRNYYALHDPTHRMRPAFAKRNRPSSDDGRATVSKRRKRS